MGCGKTRVIALVIAETSLLTPEKKIKVLWLTAKKELQVDAQNELNEIDCNVPFITVESAHDAPKGIVFAAYSSLSRKKDLNKLFGIAKWLDDECLVNTLHVFKIVIERVYTLKNLKFTIFF